MHTVEPATINYTSSGETSTATRNNVPSSPPFPAASIRNAPSLPRGFHPQSPLVPSLPRGFHPHNHLLPRVLRPYRRHIRVPLLKREFIHVIHLPSDILHRINPIPLHHHSPYSDSCRYHPCHPQTQDRSPAYCHSHLIRERMTRNTLRKHLTPLLPQAFLPLQELPSYQIPSAQ